MYLEADVVSECHVSKLPSSIHSNDESYLHAFFVETRVEEVQHANYVTPGKPLLSMRREERSKDDQARGATQKEYVDSKRRVVAEGLCYARPTRSS